jgi:ankyrin repeat protein
MAPWISTLSVAATNDRVIPSKSISARETEAERIRGKASLLRTRSADGSEIVDPSRGVSWAARQEKENMLQKFHSVAKRLTTSDTKNSTTSTETKNRPNAASLALHDLCVEANSTNDMAWRNAVTLLAKEPELAQLRTPEGWTPLHICCMGPVPLFMIRCLLYAYAPALAAADENGRLPLHMLCASPYCDLEVLQLVVEEYPAALSTKDHPGIIPLHLFLRNTAVECTTERIRILLGWTLSTTAIESEVPAKFRKGQHLQVNVATLEGWRTRSRPVAQINRATAELDNVTPDVQAALRQLAPLYVSATNASFVSPAAIPDPFEQLPLHILVHRAIILRQPLDSRYSAQSRQDTTDGQPSPSVPQVMIALRMLICAYPDALLCCNASGHTPLSAVLAQSSQAPSAEIIEYLTGTRLQLEQIPEWAHDLPLARDSPATMTSEHLQLPLHIASERWVDHIEIIRSVKEAYPAAIQQKDEKGRTPLHRCLENRTSPVSADVIELLCNDYVAFLQDDLGRTPLQVLMETKQFPAHEVSSSVYRRLIDVSPVEDPKKLVILPPWLRSQACSSPAIQAYVLQALSHPVLCSFILLDGLMLIGVIVVLRLQLNDYFDASETTNSWYTYAVYGTASCRLMLQAVVLALQGGVSALNFWSLANVIAMLSALATSVLMDGTVEEDIILNVGTASSGLLWLASIGYLSTWWYNMALFTGSLLQVRNCLWIQ